MVPTESAGTQKSSRNAIVTSMIVCVGFVVCWSCIEIINFLGFVGYTAARNTWFHYFSIVLVYGNINIKPIVKDAANSLQV